MYEDGGGRSRVYGWKVLIDPGWKGVQGYIVGVWDGRGRSKVEGGDPGCMGWKRKTKGIWGGRDIHGGRGRSRVYEVEWVYIKGKWARSRVYRVEDPDQGVCGRRGRSRVYAMELTSTVKGADPGCMGWKEHIQGV